MLSNTQATTALGLFEVLRTAVLAGILMLKLCLPALSVSLVS